MMKKYGTLLVLACFVLLYLGSIWQRPFFIPDETRYAEIPREMIASGDFIVPTLNGLPYFEKPVLGYWLNAAALKCFGEVPGAVRFMGSLGTLLSAGLVWLLCLRAGEEKTGRIASILFLLSGLVFAVGTYGVLDSQFSFFVTLTMTLFYFAWTEPSLPKRAGFLALAGIGAGLAVLTKGLLGFALPALAVVPFLIWQKEPKRIFSLPWIPLAVALVVIAPWALAVHRSEPDFWPRFLEVEHVQRFVSGHGAGDDRAQPFWFFLPVVLGGLLPWTLFFPAVWLGYLGRAGEAFRKPLLRYASCMGLVWLLFFSVSSGKLATYILPCFPAYAVLIAWGLVQYAECCSPFREADWTLRLLFRCLLPLLVVLLAVQMFNLLAPGRIPQSCLLFWRGENFLLPLVALLVFLLWLWMAKEMHGAVSKFTCFCVALWFAALVYPVAIPPHLLREIAPVGFLTRKGAEILTPDTLILADDRMAVAVAWTFRRSDIGIYGKTGEFAYGLDRMGKGGRFYTKASLEELLRRTKKPVLVVTASEKRAMEMPASPEKTCLRSGGLFLVHYR